jgi:hypothetical protein
VNSCPPGPADLVRPGTEHAADRVRRALPMHAPRLPAGQGARRGPQDGADRRVLLPSISVTHVARGRRFVAQHAPIQPIRPFISAIGITPFAD